MSCNLFSFAMSILFLRWPLLGQVLVQALRKARQRSDEDLFSGKHGSR